MKKAVIIIGVVVAVGAALYAFIPALKGPVNRVKNSTNEYLSDEYVVDNYKAEAISLVSKRKAVTENIEKFSIQKKVAEKKLELVEAREKAAKENLVATGASDLAKFNRAKDAYELAKTEAANLRTLVSVYASSIAKLEDTRAVVDSNIAKCRLNVATLESKKAMASSLKSVNETIENLQGVGEDIELGMSIEKLDDTILTQSLQIEALKSTGSAVADTLEAERYLEAVKNAAE